MTNTLSLKTTAREAAYRKLHLAALLMKWLLVGYVLFGFFRFVPWWFSREGISIEQRTAGLSLNLLSWGFLAGAVFCIWRFFDCFESAKTYTERGGHYLMRCAWLAIASQAMNLIARPINSFIVTAHLDVSLHRFDWSFTHRDPLAVVFCLALLMFAYVHRWTLDIAQENAEFV